MSGSCREKLVDAINNLTQEDVNYSKFFTELYVERTYSHRAEELVNLFELSQDTKSIIFSGQIGCGKTTELRHVKFLLESSKRKKFVVIFASPFLDGIHIADLEESDILIGIFADILIHIPDSVDLPKKTISRLEELLKKLDDNSDIYFTKGDAKTITAGLFSLFSLKINTSNEIKKKFRNNTEKNMKIIVSLFDDILEWIKVKNKTEQIVIIVDDLEKIVRDEVIIKFLRKYGNIILKRKCNFVITISNNIQFYTEGARGINTFDEFFCLPFIAIKDSHGSNNSNEINKIKNIIYRRMSKDVIDDAALELAIIYSGGSLSTLFRIYGMAINKVSLNDQCKVTPEFVVEAFYDARFRDNFIGDDRLENLRRIYRIKGDYAKLPPEELKDCLYTCILLTYRDENNNNIERYVLNPSFYTLEDLKKIEKKYNTVSPG